MSNCCQDANCADADPRRGDPAFKRILWIVLAINAAMFLVEIAAGLAAGSASLQADALDFFGDAANYAIGLFVVGMALRYRSMAALAKGATMGLFGLWVLGTVVWHSIAGTVPEAITMGVVGFAALAANAACFGLLWAYLPVTPTCARCGSALAMTCSATWPCCLRLSVCSGRERAGPMLSSRP